VRIVQKLKPLEKKSSILRVDPDLFAELIDLDENGNYKFKFKFKLNLRNKKKDPRGYSKVAITVRRDEDPKTSLANISNKFKSSQIASSGIEVNPIKKLETVNNKVDIRAIKPKNGASISKLPGKVQDKLYSGLQLIKDLNEKEEFIAQEFVNFNIDGSSATLDKFINSIFSFYELTTPAFKKDILLNRSIFESQITHARSNIDFQDRDNVRKIGPDRIDPTDLIERINLEHIEPSDPADDEDTKLLNNKSYFLSPDLRRNVVSKGKSGLLYDLAEYFIDDVAPHPREDSLARYEAQRVAKTLKEAEFSSDILVPDEYKRSKLSVRFDLYNEETNAVDETITMDLSMVSHVEAYESLKNYPKVKVTQLQAPPFSKSSTGKNRYVVKIGGSPDRRISGYNLYLKSVTKTGAVSPYRNVGFISSSGDMTEVITTKSPLSVLRVVPVDRRNRESNLFTNTVIGPGHDVIGNLTILPSHFGKSNLVKVEVINIPKNAVSISLFKRDCSENPDSNFFLYDTSKAVSGQTSYTFVDKLSRADRTYEYYAVVSTTSAKNKEVPVISNYVMYKNAPSISELKAINVTLTNPEFRAGSTGLYEIAFQIKTDVSTTENQRITDTLKNQLGELYDQFLNPQANSSSPLGDSKGIPQYNDLFFHEIVRTNLNTGERETFDLVGEGIFIDGETSQKNSNVKAIVPFFSYHYQVFTFKKNPIELFKKYIAKGTDLRGREWFYLPYKWVNSQAKSGRLYPDDKNGVPVIDAYESFTSEAYGLTASYRSTGSAQFTSLTQIVADRIDRNTVKISWQFEGASELNKSNLYDCFVVLKVVNGVRSFVGRSFKQFIYHELNSEDLGTVYYIIVPIMSEFDIDEPGYSNVLVIDPDGLTIKENLGNFSSSPIELDNSNMKKESIGNVLSRKTMVTDLKTRKGN